MRHRLEFGSRTAYDAGKAGVAIPVVLSAKGVEVLAEAKVDTGATQCVFAREVGEELGLRIEDGERATIETVTGDFTVYGHEVWLLTAGVEMESTVYFAALPGFPRNILGRRGWLDRVRLGLVDYDGLLYLSHYDDEG